METEKILKTVLLIILVTSINYSYTLSRYCNSCRDYCSGEDLNSALCKCDVDCHTFKDCCSSSSSQKCPPSHLPPLPDGAELYCLSAYINPNITITGNNEAFFMISSCPDSWIDPDGAQIREHCSSSHLTFLAPLTDNRTGLVYKNEFCALCNGVSQVAVWQTSLACNSSIYNLLLLQNLTTVLQDDPQILQRECTECSFIPPQGQGSPELAAARSCIPAVGTCSPYSSLLRLSVLEYETSVQLCQSGVMDPVRGPTSGEVYRNSACATCNGENSECLPIQNRDSTHIKQECLVGDDLGNAHPSIGVDFSFIITLSSLGKNQVLVSSGMGGTATLPVSCPEGEAPVGLDCRPTECPEGYTRSGGICSYDTKTGFLPISSPSMNCSNTTVVLSNTSFVDFGNDSILLKYDNSVVEVIDYDDLGRPIICATDPQIINCTTGLVVLNGSEYVVLENGSIIFQNVILQVMYYDKLNRPLVCPDLLTSENSSTSVRLLAGLPGIVELSYTGCSLSVVGTLALLLTYSLFRELRTYPGLVLMNLCTAILATSLTFTIGNIIIRSYPLKEVCSALAIVLHYGCLAQFAWMSVFSCEIARHFYQATKLIKESKETKHKLLSVYFTIAWLFPLIIVAITTTLNYSTNGLIQYGVNSPDQLNCWINHYEAIIVTFILPLALSLFFNLVTFTITSILLYRAYRDQSRMKKSNSFAILRVWLASFLITGLTWIFGILAIPAPSWMWYPFAIFNSTQGFAISLTFLSTRKVFNLYRQLLKGQKQMDNALHSKKTSTLTLRLSESNL